MMKDADMRSKSDKGNALKPCRNPINSCDGDLTFLLKGPKQAPASQDGRHAREN